MVAPTQFTVGNRMRTLNLPNGQILVAGATDGTLFAYNPAGGPAPEWRPTITSQVSDPQPGALFLMDGTRLAGLNASGRAPAAWSPDRFGGRTHMPQRGWETVTIPGAVSGWVALSERYGTLPFEDLFEPAIGYARDGYAVSPVVAYKWALAAPLMPQGLGWQEHFLIDGRAPAVGERFASPAMASTLTQIARTRGEAFYRGALADAMVKHANDNGSVHARSDFERHAADWVTPLGIDYRDVALHEIPVDGREHELSLYMEDTMWPYQDRFEEYIDRCSDVYAPGLERPSAMLVISEHPNSDSRSASNRGYRSNSA